MKGKRRENGSGSIVERKDTGRTEKKIRINGKRVSFYQRKNESKVAFNKRVNDEIAKRQNGTYIKKNGITHIEILKAYVKNQYETNEISKGTYGRNLNTIKEVEKVCTSFINKPIQKITERDILNALPLMTEYSNNTINKIFRYVKVPFQIAMSEKTILYNPMDSMQIKKPKSKKIDKKIETLSEDEQKKLIWAVNEDNSKYKNVILLQLYTGMRIGEVLGLKYENINFDERKIYIQSSLTRDEAGKIIMGNTTKTKKSQRTIPFLDVIENIIKNEQSKVKNINGMLFYDNERNTYYSPSSVNSYLNRLNAKYKIAKNLHTHMLRHTFATRCFELNLPMKAVQEILGHENIDVTMDIYTSVTDEFEEKQIKTINQYFKELDIKWS